jgi:MoxR-like ATPase
MTDVAAVADLAARVADSVERVILGKRTQIELALTAVLGRGHLLLEDVPGTGKTMLARSLALALGLEFGRIQCTPDLLPNDITGVSVYDPRDASFRFRPGPVFGGIVLADEINRATPRTQAALLEAMQEGQVTVDGVSHPLSRPFLVVATQNPVEFEGTFPLPEAQLDRFMLSTMLGYPSPSEEAELMVRSSAHRPEDVIEPVTGAAEVLVAMDIADGVHLESGVASSIVEIVTRSRDHESVVLGASTRATMALAAASRARAAMEGRDFVIPDDVKALAVPVLAHRIVLDPDARLRRVTPQALIGSIIDSTRIG